VSNGDAKRRASSDARCLDAPPRAATHLILRVLQGAILSHKGERQGTTRKGTTDPEGGTRRRRLHIAPRGGKDGDLGRDVCWAPARDKRDTARGASDDHCIYIRCQAADVEGSECNRNRARVGKREVHFAARSTRVRLGQWGERRLGLERRRVTRRRSVQQCKENEEEHCMCRDQERCGNGCVQDQKMTRVCHARR